MSRSLPGEAGRVDPTLLVSYVVAVQGVICLRLMPLLTDGPLPGLCKLALAELLYSSLIWSTSLFSVERQCLSLSAWLALGLEWMAGDTVSGELGRVMIAGVQVLACLIDWLSGGGAGASVFAGVLVPSLGVLDLSVVRSTISITSGSVMACVGTVSIVLGRA